MPTPAQTIGTTTGNGISIAGGLASGAFAAPVAALDTVIVVVAINSGAAGLGPSIIRDSAGNVYTVDILGGPAGGLHNVIAIAHALIPATAAGLTITVFPSENGVNITILGAMDVPGIVALAPVDGPGSSNSGNSPTNPSTGPYTTVNAVDLLVIGFVSGGATSIAAPAGWTQLAVELSGSTHADGASAYLSVASPQIGINPTWSGIDGSGNKWVAAGVAYKGGTATTNYHLLPILGMGV